MNPIKSKTAEIKLVLDSAIKYDGLIVPDVQPDLQLLNVELAKRVVSTQVKSHAEKTYKESGERIEYLAEKCGFNTNISPGNSSLLYDNGVLQLEKSVRNPVRKVDVNRFIELLTAAGVSPDLLQQSKEAATTFSKPAVFLTVKSSTHT